MHNRTIEEKYNEVEGRRAYIAERLDDGTLPGPDNVFEPLLSEIEDLLDEIRFDIDTLNETSEDNRGFYEEICNDLWDSHTKLQKVEKTVSYYELHTSQKVESDNLFEKVQDTVQELCHAFGIDFDVIPITWNQTALVRVVPEAVYGIWVPRNVSMDSFTGFAPLIAHEIGHATFDFRDMLLPDRVNEERKRIAREFGEDHEEVVANALYEWYEELYCDSIGTLTFGPAYAVSLSQQLFSDNPYELPHYSHRETQHPPDALRYENVLTILKSEFTNSIYTKASQKTQSFTEHLERLSNKKIHSYDDWFDEEFLKAIRTDAKDFLDEDTDVLATVIEAPNSDVKKGLEVRADVNAQIFGED